MVAVDRVDSGIDGSAAVAIGAVAVSVPAGAYSTIPAKVKVDSFPA